MIEEDAITAVAVLGDPLRRRLYRFVGAQDHAVGRDEAAAGVGASRAAAAFHLDRMVGDGLLEAEFRRLTGRQGPGAGRPAKLYRRSRQDISLSLPPRRYELAAGLLAAALTEGSDGVTQTGDALDRLARRRGADLAKAHGPASAGAVVEALVAMGYEPRAVHGEIVLGNCPFSGIVAGHAPLVCAMNLALLQGFTEALPRTGVQARLDPPDGACCARLTVESLAGDTPGWYIGDVPLRGRRTNGKRSAVLSTTTTITVDGMTCGHCVSSVQTEVGKVDGVTDVSVDLESGQVTIVADATPDPAALQGAVEEAGFEMRT